MHLSERSNGNSKPIAINNDNNKIIIINEAQKVSSLTKLLETIESAKPNTYFIFCFSRHIFFPIDIFGLLYYITTFLF